MTLSVFVPGTPATQGSMRYVGQSNAGRAILTSDNKHVKPWRSDVRSALIDDQGQPKARFEGPVHIGLEFILPRPKSAPKRKTPSADRSRMSDIDKLERAILDAVTSAGVWRDDAQVTSVSKLKRIAEIGETPGCRINLRNAT